ncbi:hypothetical protein MSTE_00876 [Mycobacteroides stephanolepidis]|uniref:Uncharacterized protein n=1 Tax=[Mycobacterium] stephanolepidis TaxID=1520670 RepID=A0A1Z4ETC1_9MYCO|nr:hypothetical protein [[Mycobacterium] stephanolepidis]BAX96211.1 hypothetical protein MSTE_00876 [[Mycobacterium] stephanolepidis]
MDDDKLFGDVYSHIADTTVNPTAQTIFTVILGCLVAAAAVYGVVEFVRTKRPLVLVLLPTAALISVFEPITDIVGHLYIFEHGANVAYTLAGRGMPWWVLLGHTLAWTLAGWLGCYFVSRGCRARTVVVLFLVGVAGNILLELPVTQSGLESYFGSQPLMAFGTFPISWAFTNQAGGIVAGAAIGAAWRWLTGWRILAIIPLMPGAVIGGIWFCAWPVFVTMNRDYLTTSPSLWIAVPAALLAIALAFSYVNIAARVLCNLPGPTAARVASPEGEPAPSSLTAH